MPDIFTIGYEGADPDRFVAALKGAGVASIADVRAVALSRKRGFSKNVLRDRLQADGIGYRHFIALGTPKSGREAARAGDAGTLRRIYCDEVLAGAPARGSCSRAPRTSPPRNPSACSASSASRPCATGAFSPSGWRRWASGRWISR
jgi:hypothetical protein